MSKRPGDPRPLQLKVMLSQREKLWLTQLAARQGVTARDAVRLWIRERWKAGAAGAR